MNTDTAIYATFVLTVVAEEDKSRSIWPSCPALGWTAGVHRLTSLPNGNPLVTPVRFSQIDVERFARTHYLTRWGCSCWRSCAGVSVCQDDAKVIETHGPYQHGGGWPTVNGFNDLEMFDPNIPINVRILQ